MLEICLHSYHWVDRGLLFSRPLRPKLPLGSLGQAVAASFLLKGGAGIRVWCRGAWGLGFEAGILYPRVQVPKHGDVIGAKYSTYTGFWGLIPTLWVCSCHRHRPIKAYTLREFHSKKHDMWLKMREQMLRRVLDTHSSGCLVFLANCLDV